MPEDALVLLAGDGTVGAALTAHAGVGGVMFTGSTEVAKLIAAALAGRLRPDGQPIPLIAETGGQNALIVDSSALPEQVVADALASAFDSAGQRCSALRVLCLQDDVADRMLEMVKAAMAELEVGPPDRLSADVGPVISAEARDKILAHVEAMRARGFAVTAAPLGEAHARGFFVAPTLIEIGTVADLGREVFGPALHVLRFKRRDAAGADRRAQRHRLRADRRRPFAHRHDHRPRRVAHRRRQRLRQSQHHRRDRRRAAVRRPWPVGHRAEGGRAALSPSGSSRAPRPPGRRCRPARRTPPPRLSRRLSPNAATRRWRALCEQIVGESRLGVSLELPGPVGEKNVYSLEPRGAVLCDAADEATLIVQAACALATGNRALLSGAFAAPLVAAAPEPLRGRVASHAAADRVDAALTDRDGAVADRLRRRDRAPRRADRLGLPRDRRAIRRGEPAPLDFLLNERSVCINTTAAGGNASLMTIG